MFFPSSFYDSWGWTKESILAWQMLCHLPITFSSPLLPAILKQGLTKFLMLAPSLPCSAGTSSTCDPPASASWAAGVTGLYHQAWLYAKFLLKTRPSHLSKKLQRLCQPLPLATCNPEHYLMNLCSRDFIWKWDFLKLPHNVVLKTKQITIYELF